MPRFEYKTIPAPTKGRKGKGVRGAEARFAFALECVMNEMAAEGWEYQRAETLPSTERSGLTSTSTQWRNILIFRRPHESDMEAFAPELLPSPAEPEMVEETDVDLGEEIVSEEVATEERDDSSEIFSEEK